MPDRIIRDELFDSERFLDLADNTHRICYIACLLRVDDFANMEASPRNLTRLWRDFGPDSREKSELIFQHLCDVDLLRAYEIDGKRYLHVPRFRQRKRYFHSCFPLSPWNDDNEIKELQKKSQSLDSPRTDSSPTQVAHARADVDVDVDVDVEEKKTIMSSSPKKTANCDLKKQAVEVLEFLNEKTGRKYRAVETTLKPIICRLKSGVTVQECRTMIMRKVHDWQGNPEMDQYLRPSTLFRPAHFEDYLGQTKIKLED